MNILIFGATSYLGRSLVNLLSANQENRVFCVSRSSERYGFSENTTWINHDLQKEPWSFSRSFFDVVVFCADTHLVQSLDQVITTEFFLLVSSASRVVKQSSKNPDDIELVNSLSRDESYVENRFNNSFILRPTWIYCGPNDKIASIILDFVKKFRILPLTLAAKGKRNPISAYNLAQVICWCLENQKMALQQKHLNVGGALTLNYDHLIKSLIKEQGRYYITLRLPEFVYVLVIRILHRLNLKKELKEFMFQHMDVDLNICNSEAQELGINLRAFNAKS